MPRPAASLAAAATLVLAGCGDTKLTGSSVEQLIAKHLAEARGYAGAKVSCDDIDNKVGKRFTCSVRGIRGKSKVDGTVASGDRVAVDRLR